QISDALIGELVAAAGKFSSPLSAFIFFYMHGAGTRVPVTDTAFSARRAQWDFDAIGQWAEGSQSATHIAWLRDIWSRVEPHLKGSVYVNHVAADDLPEKVRASFGDNYQRLRELKAKFDPTNLFRVNANIPPALYWQWREIEGCYRGCWYPTYCSFAYSRPMRRDASSVNPPHARPEVRWCLELPRIPQKHNALGRLGNDQDVRQGHLGSFIDEKDVDDLSGIGACPEPRGSC